MAVRCKLGGVLAAIRSQRAPPFQPKFLSKSTLFIQNQVHFAPGWNIGEAHHGPDPQPGRTHQPAEEETARHAELATVLDGHSAQSALVHGFQRIFSNRRWL